MVDCLGGLECSVTSLFLSGFYIQVAMTNPDGGRVDVLVPPGC